MCVIGVILLLLLLVENESSVSGDWELIISKKWEVVVDESKFSNKKLLGVYS